MSQMKPFCRVSTDLLYGLRTTSPPYQGSIQTYRWCQCGLELNFNRKPSDCWLYTSLGISKYSLQTFLEKEKARPKPSKEFIPRVA